MTDTRYQEYLEEYKRYSSLNSQNLRQQDSVLIQLSVGLLAVMATLGEKILRHHKGLGVALMILLAATLLQAVIGYWLSDKFYIKAMKKLGKNYDKGRDLYKGIHNIWQSKLNRFLNTTVFLTFTAALVVLVILVLNYVLGLK